MVLELSPEAIERVIPAGVGRVVIDLFQGTGTPTCGSLIHDFCDTYQIDLVLILQTTHSGSRVLATLCSPSSAADTSG